jgi:hypothetical protein
VSGCSPEGVQEALSSSFEKEGKAKHQDGEIDRLRDYYTATVVSIP